MKSNHQVSPVALADAITEATDCIGALYPLTNFIACNALKGFEKIPFELAMRKSGELFGASGFLPLSDYRAMYESGRINPGDLEEAFQHSQKFTDAKAECDGSILSVAEMLDRTGDSKLVDDINRHMIKWCAAYLDRTQSQWQPIEKNGLYSFWKELARYDLSLAQQGVKDWVESVDSMPSNAQDALQTLLDELDLRQEDFALYLRRHVVQLPGYASYLKWRETEKVEAGILLDYFAIRLHYEKKLSQVISKQLHKSIDLRSVRKLLCEQVLSHGLYTTEDDYGPVWQEAYEINYRNELLESLQKDAVKEKPPCCQLIFCIDVRSEPIRRQIEKLGPYATYGFAGFFGMAMRFNSLGSAMSLDLCPVLLKPEKQVKETSEQAASAKKLSWQALTISALQLKKKLKCNLAGAFGLVELFGLFSAIPLALKTFFPSPSKYMLDNIVHKCGGTTVTKLDLAAFSLDEKIALAQSAINGIGLTDFGQVVVLCGHKSSSHNNPFASSLDCGACGGNGGGASARLAATILNDVSVREGLALKGSLVPANTLFVAAEHDTTTDKFEFFESGEISSEHSEILSKLKADLLTAGASARSHRSGKLPQGSFDMLNDPLERSCDWAQIAPEWGLAGNAAFIAAPREVSKGADLQGRVFLHSYDCSNDADAKVLELIMTAPLVVAQWINMQYYLSTVDNKIFGSGSKVVHNVVGDFGVMQGASSDLRVGLPLQSLRTDLTLMHEPMRLLAVIRAPLASIDRVLEKHPDVRKLVVNRWIRLVALDPQSTEFYEADDCGQWRQIKSTNSALQKSLATGKA